MGVLVRCILDKLLHFGHRFGGHSLIGKFQFVGFYTDLIRVKLCFLL